MTQIIKQKSKSLAELIQEVKNTFPKDNPTMHRHMAAALLYEQKGQTVKAEKYINMAIETENNS